MNFALLLQMSTRDPMFWIMVIIAASFVFIAIAMITIAVLVSRAVKTVNRLEEKVEPLLERVTAISEQGKLVAVQGKLIAEQFTVVSGHLSTATQHVSESLGVNWRRLWRASVAASRYSWRRCRSPLIKHTPRMRCSSVDSNWKMIRTDPSSSWMARVLSFLSTDYADCFCHL